MSFIPSIYSQNQIYRPHTDIEKIDQEFEEFLKTCRRCQNDEKNIRKAYEFMKQAFSDRKRRSGDLFIYHNLSVAKIVAFDIGLDSNSIIAALLHDIIAETDTSIQDIKFLFGEKISNLVSSLTNIKGTSQFFSETKTEYYKQMLSSIPDIRVIYVKIADRLDNMRTIFALNSERQKQIAKETLLVYVPFTEILGLYSIKHELEDRAFKVLNPKKFNYILSHIKTSERKSLIYLNRISLPIIKALLDAGFKFSIHSRQKSIYSIYKKLIRKKLTIEQIYDIYAIRIIITPKSNETEKQECYQVEKIIKNIYPEELPERRRDWIKEPKNEYEALHITVKAKGKWLEIQIRSERMHDIAEHGIAAHYKYKGIKIEQTVFDEKLKQLIKHLDSFENFLQDEYLDIFQSDKIVVYTRKGEPISIPKGSTAVDFAFFINSELAKKFIGVKINGKLQKPDYILRPGDRVEIITYQNKEPSKDLLNYITIPEFLQEYSQILKQNELAKQGERIFANLLLRNNIKEQEKDSLIASLTKKFNFSYEFEFLEKLATDKQFIKQINDFLQAKNQSFFNLILGKRRFKKATIELADCCKPDFTDEVFYIEENDKIVLHKKDCKNLRNYVKKHNLKPSYINFEKIKTPSISVKIVFRSEDQFGLYYQIAQIFYKDLNLNLKRVCMTTNHADIQDETDTKLQNPIENYVAGEIEFYVKEKSYIKEIEKKLKKLKAVYFLSITTEENT